MVVIVAALRAMQAAGTLKNADITVVLTGDEEEAGQPIAISRRDLIAAGKRADVALDFEGLAQTTVNGRSTWARSRGAAPAAGRSRSTGRDRPFERHLRPSGGKGAIYELARILEAFRRELPEDNLTYNVGLIGGGATAELDAGQDPRRGDRQDQHHPATAIARGDLRAISHDQIERAPRRRCARSSPSRCPGAKAEISFDDGCLSADGADRRPIGRCSAG